MPPVPSITEPDGDHNVRIVVPYPHRMNRGVVGNTDNEEDRVFTDQEILDHSLLHEFINEWDMVRLSEYLHWLVFSIIHDYPTDDLSEEKKDRIRISHLASQAMVEKTKTGQD